MRTRIVFISLTQPRVKEEVKTSHIYMLLQSLFHGQTRENLRQTFLGHKFLQSNEQSTREGDFPVNLREIYFQSEVKIDEKKRFARKL